VQVLYLPPKEEDLTPTEIRVYMKRYASSIYIKINKWQTTLLANLSKEDREAHIKLYCEKGIPPLRVIKGAGNDREERL
jgi:hypothetical protein